MVAAPAARTVSRSSTSARSWTIAAIRRPSRSISVTARSGSSAAGSSTAPPPPSTYEMVSDNVTAWLAVHLGGAVLFPLMALVVWLMIRGLPGRAATIARCALPVYAVFYTVWEAIFGIANGLLADTGNHLSGAQREGTAEAVNDIVSSPLFGDAGVFGSVGGLAWWTAIAAAIMALKHAGVRPAVLVLLGLAGLMSFHVPPIGPPALVCLSLAAYMVERHRAAAPATALRPLPA